MTEKRQRRIVKSQKHCGERWLHTLWKVLGHKTWRINNHDRETISITKKVLHVLENNISYSLPPYPHTHTNMPPPPPHSVTSIITINISSIFSWSNSKTKWWVLFYISIIFFSSISLQVVRKWELLLVLFCLLVIDIIVLVAWQVLDPLYRHLETFPPEEPKHTTEDIMLEPYLEHCSSKNINIWLGRSLHNFWFWLNSVTPKIKYFELMSYSKFHFQMKHVKRIHTKNCKFHCNLEVKN